MKVSIISAVYNTAPYLDRCIESIVNQSYENIEIILVNDGSTDESGEICKKWAEKDSRIVYLVNENGGHGPSAARNMGIENSTGQFICFVDSDDCVAPFYVEKMMNIHKETGKSLVMCGFVLNDETTPVERIPVPLMEHPIEIIDEKNYYLRLFTDKEVLHAVIWNKLYAKSLFDNVRFDDGKLHEDEGIIPHIVSQCDGIAVCYQPLYFYTQRPGSIMNKDDFQPYNLDVFPYYQDRMDYFTAKGWLDLTFLTMKAYLLGCLLLYKKIDKNTPDGKMYKNHLMTMFKNMLAQAKKCPVKSKKFLLKMDYYAFFPTKFNPADRNDLLFN